MPEIEMSQCSHTDVELDAQQGCFVCRNCGLVVDEMVTSNDVSAQGHNHIRMPKYRRLYHFNERLSQLCLNESRVDKLHMEKIAEIATIKIQHRIPESIRERDPDKYRTMVRALIDKSFIQEVLREAGGVAFTKKYLEKWLTIRLEFLGDMPTPLSGTELDNCRRLFCAIEEAFTKIKSNWTVKVYSSKKYSTLHKWLKPAAAAATKKTTKKPVAIIRSVQKVERQHIPNLNYTLRFILRRIGRIDLLKFLPLMKDQKKVREHERIFFEMCEQNCWTFHSVLHAETIESFAVCKD